MGESFGSWRGRLHSGGQAPEQGIDSCNGIGGHCSPARQRLEHGPMPLIRSRGREEQDIGGPIVVREMLFVIAGPDHFFRDAEVCGESLEMGAMLALADDHHPRLTELGSNEAEGLESFLEASARRELADHHDERSLAADPMESACIGPARGELTLVDRRGGKSRLLPAKDG